MSPHFSPPAVLWDPPGPCGGRTSPPARGAGAAPRAGALIITLLERDALHVTPVTCYTNYNEIRIYIYTKYMYMRQTD